MSSLSNMSALKPKKLSERVASAAIGSRYAWLVWALGASLFFVEYFARVAPSIMTTELMRDFHIQAFTFGLLSAYFYYPYILMQIPVGVLVDKYGPTRLMVITGVLCTLSCLIFASASSFTMAAISRLLLGFSAAFAFVGVLKLATNWFPPSRIGLLAGLTQGSGMLGASIGEGPMSLVSDALGWRKTMVLISIIYIALTIFIYWIVSDKPKKSERLTSNSQLDLSNESAKLWAGLKEVLRNKQSWLNGLFVGCLYAPTAAFGELWGVSYLQTAYGFSHAVASTGVGFIFIGMALGCPVIGWLSDFIYRRKSVMIASALGGLIMILLVLYGHDWFGRNTVFALLFIYGFTNAGVGVSYAFSAEINPPRISGTSLAFANMSSVIVGATLQPIIGEFVDLSWDHTMAAGVPVYRLVDFYHGIWILPLSFVISIVVCFFLKETFCENQAREEERA